MHKTTHLLSIKGNADKLHASKTLRILALAMVTLVGNIVPAKLYAQSACYSWSNQIPMQDAVDQNTCINVVPGSYSMHEEVTVRSGGTVTINGNGAIFTATRPPVGPGESSFAWREEPLWANRSMFRSALNSRLVMSNATLDGSNIASYLVTAKNDSSRYSIDRMTLKNGACSAVGIFSGGISITNSYMVHNGHNCKVFSGIREAAAIYSEKQHNGYHFSPVITGNIITDSYGPALDINGTWGGTFSNNRVYGNTEWAAVSLYGASYWKLSGNSISHPANSSVQNYHPYCQPTGGPIGNRSAAIFLCQDSGVAPYLTNFNLIENNSVSSGYGILLVGSDETLPWMAPRVNIIRNNNVIGSLYGCADDLKLNQWFDANTWAGNNCAGVPNTGPFRF
jgi:parallel beta-helix repeat protein